MDIPQARVWHLGKLSGERLSTYRANSKLIKVEKE